MSFSKPSFNPVLVWEGAHTRIVCAWDNEKQWDLVTEVSEGNDAMGIRRWKAIQTAIPNVNSITMQYIGELANGLHQAIQDRRTMMDKLVGTRTEPVPFTTK